MNGILVSAAVLEMPLRLSHCFDFGNMLANCDDAQSREKKRREKTPIRYVKVS